MCYVPIRSVSYDRMMVMADAGQVRLSVSSPVALAITGPTKKIDLQLIPPPTAPVTVAFAFPAYSSSG
jgi:hypothetical protein